jgi:hypothetical protein
MRFPLGSNGLNGRYWAHESDAESVVNEAPHDGGAVARREPGVHAGGDGRVRVARERGGLGHRPAARQCEADQRMSQVVNADRLGAGRVQASGVACGADGAENVPNQLRDIGRVPGDILVVRPFPIARACAKGGSDLVSGAWGSWLLVRQFGSAAIYGLRSAEFDDQRFRPARPCARRLSRHAARGAAAAKRASTDALHWKRAIVGGSMAARVGDRAGRRHQSGRRAADEVHVVARIERSRRASHQRLPAARGRRGAGSHRWLWSDRVQRVIDLLLGTGVLPGHREGRRGSLVVRDDGADLLGATRALPSTASRCLEVPLEELVSRVTMASACTAGTARDTGGSLGGSLGRGTRAGWSRRMLRQRASSGRVLAASCGHFADISGIAASSDPRPKRGNPLLERASERWAVLGSNQ